MNERKKNNNNIIIVILAKYRVSQKTWESRDESEIVFVKN